MGERGLMGICGQQIPDQTAHLCSLIRSLLSVYRILSPVAQLDARLTSDRKVAGLTSSGSATFFRGD